jgi:hypothetical protein
MGTKLDRAQHDLTGDIKKLKGFENNYRRRAGGLPAVLHDAVV